MNRQLRFRAWDPVSKQWDRHPQNFIRLNDGKLFFGNANIDGYPLIVQQFTGLYDKNGKPVFTGDIVRAWSQGYQGVFEVRWRDDGGGAPMYILYPAYQNKEMWHIKASREVDGLVYDRGLEVIGNVFETPELIAREENE